MEDLKTGSVFEQMNYFLALKENGGVSNSLYEDKIIPGLSSIFANMVKNGSRTVEDAERFCEMLPMTGMMFDKPNLHGDCLPLKSQFQNMVQVGLVERKIDQSAIESPMGKVI